MGAFELGILCELTNGRHSSPLPNGGGEVARIARSASRDGEGDDGAG
jgi:hypothetical protein